MASGGGSEEHPTTAGSKPLVAIEGGSAEGQPKLHRLLDLV